jgi:hypothetical protein
MWTFYIYTKVSLYPFEEYDNADMLRTFNVYMCYKSVSRTKNSLVNYLKLTVTWNPRGCTPKQVGISKNCLENISPLEKFQALIILSWCTVNTDFIEVAKSKEIKLGGWI